MSNKITCAEAAIMAIEAFEEEHEVTATQDDFDIIFDTDDHSNLVWKMWYSGDIEGPTFEWVQDWGWVLLGPDKERHMAKVRKMTEVHVPEAELNSDNFAGI